jgi:hypothetical protein
MNKIHLMGKNHWDDYDTPKYAFDMLLEYIPKGSIIFECAVGKGKLKRIMEDAGFIVVSSKDFFNDNNYKYDIVITNPPFSLKDEFIKKCYELNKPFALLLPITAIEGKVRQALYKKYGIEILLPNNRIQYMNKKGVWFYSAWFCWKLLPKQIVFSDKVERQ